MRLHRFFLQENLDAKSEITISDKELLNQWKKVFRFEKGDTVILLDNTGFEYKAEFELLTRDEAGLRIVSSRDARHSPKREVILYCSLIKKDHFELVLEKGTELGVAAFVPVLSERSEKKGLNMERARKIIREASEQSGRGTLPELSDIAHLEAVLDHEGPLVAFHPEGTEFRPSEIGSGTLGVLIGPEGGWSEKELELFKEKNIPIRSLSTQVLRAETAAIAIPALLLL